MTPPNTVPITAEELNSILKNPNCGIYTLVKNVFKIEDSDPDFDWIQHPPFCPNLVSKDKEYRISKDDYRHYFGEVVDLKEHVTGSVLQYMGDAFILTRDDEPNYYTLYECIDNGYPDRLILTDLESQCKKIVINYFTALFKKDLPHLNIKFVWS